MNLQMQSISALSQLAHAALVERLGVVDAMRFLHHLRAGHGDFTAERRSLLAGESVPGVVADIKAQRRLRAHGNDSAITG